MGAPSKDSTPKQLFTRLVCKISCFILLILNLLSLVSDKRKKSNDTKDIINRIYLAKKIILLRIMFFYSFHDDQIVGILLCKFQVDLYV